MSDICIKKDCDLQKHTNTNKCLLHCNKKDFLNTEISIFWDLVRSKYLEFYRNKVDAEFDKVVFPEFQTFNSNRYNFLSPYMHGYNISVNIKFTNCIFTKDFNLFHSASTSEIKFDNCTFYGDIQFNKIENIKVINSEFKNELTLGNQNWKKVFIEKTKFIKKVNFNILEKLNIDNKSIFRSKLIIYGFNSLELLLENSSLKDIEISNTKNTMIKNLESISTLVLKEENTFISLENLKLNKNIFIHNYGFFTCNNVKFYKSLFFTSTSYGSFRFKNVHLDKLHNIEAIDIEITENSKIKNIILDKDNASLLLEDSKVTSLKVGNVKKICINNSILEEDINITRNSDELLISNSILNASLIIQNCIKISLTNNKIIADFKVLEGNDEIFVDNLFIKKSFQINSSKKININKLKGYPFVKLNTNDSAFIHISASRLNTLELTKNIELKLNDVICKNKILFSDEMFSSIYFNNVKSKQYIELPELSILNISSSVFYKGVTFNEANDISILDNSNFKGPIWVKTIKNNLFIKESIFESNSSFVSIKNKFEIYDVMFKQSLDLTQSEFNIIDIKNSVFSKVDFSESKIKKLSIQGDVDGPSFTVFNDDILFLKTFVEKLDIKYSNFKKELIFRDGNMSFANFDVLNINHLTICNFEIKDLFKKTKKLIIERFDLENSTIESVEANETIINSLYINEFNINKLRLIDNFSLLELESKKLRISNSNIEKIFRIESSNIEVINSISNIFEDIQIIDNKNDDNDSNRELRFKNTTIKNSVFDKLKYNTFNMSDAHVSDAKIGLVKFEEGSRETNRFFKNYYDSISDYVYANTYYKAEMDELYKTTKNWIEKAPLFLNKYISNFGQSWIKPLLWLVFFTILFFIFAEYDSLIKSGYIENHYKLIWNDFFRFINPFSKKASDKYFDVYSIWLTHKLIMTVLIYHFVISIKRQTKR